MPSFNGVMGVVARHAVRVNYGVGILVARAGVRARRWVEVEVTSVVFIVNVRRSIVIPILRTSISQFYVKLGRYSIFIDIHVRLFPVLRRTVNRMAMRAKSGAAVFIASGLITVRSASVSEAITQRLSNLITCNEGIRAGVMERVLTSFVTPNGSRFPATNLRAASIRPGLTIPIVVSRERSILFLMRRIGKLFLRVFRYCARA